MFFLWSRELGVAGEPVLCVCVSCCGKGKKWEIFLDYSLTFSFDTQHSDSQSHMANARTKIKLMLVFLCVFFFFFFCVFLVSHFLMGRKRVRRGGYKNEEGRWRGNGEECGRLG